MAEVDRFNNDVAIVTGGAQGIGEEIVKLFADGGAKVGILDVQVEKAAAIGRRWPGSVVAVQCDILDGDDVTKAIAELSRTVGAPNILVNNAGITRDALITRMSDKDWDAVLDVNLKGAFICTRAFALHAKESAGKDEAVRLAKSNMNIVNVSSIVGKLGNIGQVNYSAAKAGMIGLTKTAARELGRYQVRVNAVQPGFIDTAMTRKIPDDIRERRIADIPLGRAGQVSEVASAIGFLASRDASYVTGAVLEVTGGRGM